MNPSEHAATDFRPKLHELVLVFVVHRAAVLWVTGWGAFIDPRGVVGAGRERDLAGGAATAIDRLCYGDCLRYEAIAKLGYRATSDADLIPLLPMIARAIRGSTGLPVSWALVALANIAALVGFIAATDFVARMTNGVTSKWFGLIWITWPFGFVLAAGGSESLTLATVSLALAFSARSRWWLTGIALAAGVLIHVFALLVVPAILVLYLQASRRVRYGDLLAFAFPVAALCALRFVFGYDLRAAFPVRTAGPAMFEGSVSVLVILALFVVTSVGFSKDSRSRANSPIGLSLAAWATAALVAVAVFVRHDSVAIVGWCFAPFVTLAAWGARRPNAGVGIVTLFAVLQGFALYLYAHGFSIL